MAKILQALGWVEELLPQECITKRMFGGFAYYRDYKLILVLFESEGNREYRGQKFDFEIWNGCLFPVEKENQESVISQFPFLINHPVLPKWLYIPLETEDFESKVQSLMKELRRQNPLFGTIPNRRGSKKVLKSNKADELKGIEKYLSRTPKMFSDEPGEKIFEKAQKISQLKNLGPAAEKTFLKAGIKTPAQAQKLGWKKVMMKLVEVDSKNSHSIFAYAVIGALKNQIWHRLPAEEKKEAQAFMKSLRDQGKKGKKKTKKIK